MAISLNLLDFYYMNFYLKFILSLCLYVACAQAMEDVTSELENVSPITERYAGWGNLPVAEQDIIPSVCVQKIFSFLDDPADFGHFRVVCKEFKKLCQAHWQNMIFKEKTSLAPLPVSLSDGLGLEFLKVFKAVSQKFLKRSLKI